MPRDAERDLPLLEVREPTRDLNDIILSTANRRVFERILQEQGHAELLGSRGLRPIAKTLFCGPPGCGKTLGAEVLATELGLPLVVVRFDTVVSFFLGETSSVQRQLHLGVTTTTLPHPPRAEGTLRPSPAAPRWLQGPRFVERRDQPRTAA